MKIVPFSYFHVQPIGLFNLLFNSVSEIIVIYYAVIFNFIVKDDGEKNKN